MCHACTASLRSMVAFFLHHASTNTQPCVYNKPVLSRCATHRLPLDASKRVLSPAVGMPDLLLSVGRSSSSEPPTDAPTSVKLWQRPALNTRCSSRPGSTAHAAERARRT
eukprot:3497595-Rhodomonas_salina.2